MKLDPEYEEWIINFIRKELRFHPSIDPKDFFLPFSINRPFAVYDISKMSDQQLHLLHELGPQALQNCLKPGYKLYAVDWHHNVILYDPLRPEEAMCACPALPFRTADGLGYYLSFFPDGDYYFYLDRFGAFGYLSHPWRQEVWVYGISLVEEFEKIHTLLGWIPKAAIK